MSININARIKIFKEKEFKAKKNGGEVFVHIQFYLYFNGNVCDIIYAKRNISHVSEV
jgi:hypothetical protein